MLAFALAATALVAAIGGLAMHFASPASPALSFVVGSGVDGKVGQWVAAEPNTPLTVRFSDETTWTLEPGARMRVIDATAHGAALTLERGTLRADVEHRGDDTSWSLQAGPFEVLVTGTSFSASWDPDTEVFDVHMTEGSVVVAGPHLPPGRSLVAGERLNVSIREGRMELTADTAPAVDPPAPRAEEELRRDAESKDEQSAESSPSDEVSDATRDPKTTAARSWQSLATAGKHVEAYRAVEQMGFSQTLAGASAADLMLLANTARFAGAPRQARAALLALRQRYGGGGATAFLLGKIAIDQLGQAGEAATWFETYLREQPNGALAEQALGRLVEIRGPSKSKAGRAAAKDYLRRFPDGPHAALARSVLSD